MRFTTYILPIFFLALAVGFTLTLIGCDRIDVKQAAIVYGLDEESADTVLDTVQSALDSIALENTVKLFYMWDNEF